MLNWFTVIGRLSKVISYGEGKGGIITIENSRPFKNAEGIYESDFIDFRVFDKCLEAMMEYCKEGDLVGVKGRIQTRNEEIEKITELIGEKIIFLNSSKKEPSSINEDGEENE